MSHLTSLLADEHPGAGDQSRPDGSHQDSRGEFMREPEGIRNAEWRKEGHIELQYRDPPFVTEHPSRSQRRRNIVRSRQQESGYHKLSSSDVHSPLP